jgi:hypothetical protein
MRVLSLVFVLVAALVGAAMVLPVCPSGKRTPPAEVGRCILAAGTVGAFIGGGLATLVVVTARLLANRGPK